MSVSSTAQGNAVPPVQATVPLEPWVTLLTKIGSPSGSLSLASTSMVTAVSSGVVSASSSGTGGKSQKVLRVA